MSTPHDGIPPASPGGHTPPHAVPPCPHCHAPMVEGDAHPCLPFVGDTSCLDDADVRAIVATLSDALDRDRLRGAEGNLLDLALDVLRLRARVRLLEGTIRADEERLTQAAIRVWGENPHGCDAPLWMADELVAFRELATAPEGDLNGPPHVHDRHGVPWRERALIRGNILRAIAFRTTGREDGSAQEGVDRLVDHRDRALALAREALALLEPHHPPSPPEDTVAGHQALRDRLTALLAELPCS